MRTETTMLVGTAFFGAGAIALGVVLTALPAPRDDAPPPRTIPPRPSPPDPLTPPPDLEGAPSITLPPLVIVAPRPSTGPLVARPRAPPRPFDQMRCSDWRPLTMGSGSVRVCE